MSVVYRCVKKNDEKGYFFSSCAVCSTVIIKGRKNAIFIGKGYIFYNILQKVAEVRE